MSPGRISQFLLLAAAGESEAEFVAGDLQEEFTELAERRGQRAAGRWYFRQVLRSILPLLKVRIRSGEFNRILFAAGAAVLPLAALDRLWSFVYSQIPLKESLHRSPALLAINLVCLALCASAGGDVVRTRREAVLSVIFSAFFAALSLWIAPGPAPAPYVLLALAAAPAGFIAAFRWRSSR